MLKKLVFRGFRNLEDGTWLPAGGVNLLSGPNGAGKTSLLESVYLLATTKSFRSSQPADCCHHERQEFSLFGVVAEHQDAGRAELSVEWDQNGLSRGVNGVATSLAEHLAPLPVVYWGSSDARVLDGEPAERRRFLDQGVVALRPGALEVLGRYRRALAAKRELLRAGHAVGSLSAWNEVLAETAIELVRARAVYATAIAQAVGALRDELAVDLPPLGIAYRPSPPAALEGRDAILAVLEENREREIEAGRPLFGPHRDELELSWGGHPVRRVSSAGEKKLFGLLLARARGEALERSSRAPLYLLDDVAAELDSRRLEAVMDLFSAARQVFVSACQSDLPGTLGRGHRWSLERGRVCSSK